MKLNLAHLIQKKFLLAKLPNTGVYHVVDESGESVMIAGTEGNIDAIALAVCEIPNMVMALEAWRDNLLYDKEGFNFLMVDGILQRLAKKE